MVWGGVRVCGGGGLGVGCVCVCVWGGGGGPCSYFTLTFCKHTLVGSTLHFIESNKLSL